MEEIFVKLKIAKDLSKIILKYLLSSQDNSLKEGNFE
jgi:hypothetical protein